jgi:hypothetical protein
VSPRQRKFRCAVVEGGGLPGSRRMARLARLAEVASDMVRIRRARKIRAVTLVAIGIDKSVVIVRVARLTLERGMLSGQCKLPGIVVE